MAENTYKEYRVTWIHEVYFKAKDDAEARDIWKEMDLSISNGPSDNRFIENMSFECVDDDYRDIP